jgi:hypothetical protein
MYIIQTLYTITLYSIKATLFNPLPNTKGENSSAPANGTFLHRMILES